MVSNNAMACAMFAVGANSRYIFGSGNQCTERIDVVIVMHALHHSRNALQPHSRVNGWTWQWISSSVSLSLELHENQVPNFNKPIAVFIGTARRPTGNTLAMIVKYLATRATRTGIAHRPEII